MTNEVDELRVVLVDDHPLYRDGLRTLLETTPSTTVVAAVGTGGEAIEAAEAAQPDVVVMDLQLPDIHGIEATRRITSTSPHIAVLVLTMFEDDDSIFAAMRAGARGYLLKGAAHDAIRRAVRAVAAGESIFSPGVANRLVDFFASRHSGRGQEAFPQLTPRETEVLELLADGHPNEAIARRLSLSGKTVRNHVSNIFTKLQVADRAEAIVRARRAGLGDEGGRSMG
ncbi:MAG TPA: response regulator transcription factor [Actinomycetota bacterium]|nr:response regulator transcription factor [Actinomycetota bacterium]